MTVPRREIVINDEVGTYHCTSRCVRRAFLCGEDLISGRSFNHRKDWIKARLAFLVEVFAVQLLSYAVMSNHQHTLLRNRPDMVSIWSDEEVARRWLTLFPRKKKKFSLSFDEQVEELARDLVKIHKYRARLSSISWFNRCLNEYIARKANAEDDCKGRFWEGRFRCQRVEDTKGIVSCSVYIDLNPIRAGVATTPEESEFTSIKDRIDDFVGTANFADSPSLLSVEEMTLGVLSREEYISLVDISGRILSEGKSSISSRLEPLLSRIGILPQRWEDIVTKLCILFPRVVGPAEAIRKAAGRAGKLWFHGTSNAHNLFIS